VCVLEARCHVADEGTEGGEAVAGLPVAGMTVLEALADVRAALRARSVFDRLLDDAVTQACATGVSVTVLARVLGIHRATFYRQFREVQEHDATKSPAEQATSC
jgi:AraC-like DNA-binding protein